MMRKAFILLAMVALLWLSGCATVTPVTAYGPCDEGGAVPGWECR